MSLDFKNSNQGSGLSFLNGTFVNVGTIVRAEDIAKQDIFNNGNPVDCGVKLTLEVGRSFQPEMKIYGNFKTANGEVTWGSAFAVKTLFQELGIDGKLNDDGHIPQDILDSLVGKKILRLSYVRDYDHSTQKKKYGDYRFIAVAKDFEDPKQVSDAATRLTNKFIKDVSAGWVKNFKPDAGNDASVSFP